MKINMPRLSLAFLALVLISSVFTVTAKGDEWNKKTVVTFSGPVDVSGHRLEAGTYVFKLADSSDRHIVQIFSGDEKHIMATILAMPDYRITPTDNTSIKFSETAGNVTTAERDLPQAGIPIKEWFYPGDNFGQEFRVKSEPTVAQATPMPTAEVGTESTEPPSPPSPEEKSDVKPEDNAVGTPAVQTPPEPVEEAPAQQEAKPEASPTSSPSTPDSTKTTTPSELPQTASSLPLIALIGVGSLGVGLSLRQIVKHMA